MNELLVIDKILDILVPVKLRGKRMSVLMERGVKIMFLVVVAVIAIERILRKTIEAIGDTNQWSYAIGCMMLYLFITIMIYALVMGGINMLISTMADMKRERVVEAKPDVQESDVVLEEESKTVVAEAVEAKDRIRQITRTQTDDLPTRKEMWDQLEKQKPLLAEYYSLINDPDALIRKAQEVKDAQLRNTMYALAKAALGGNLVPKQFSYEDSPAGKECVVVGSTEFRGEYRAVHILPNGMVFSTDSFSVKDVKTVRMHPYPQIWIYHGTIDDLYLQIQIERMINATLVTPIHFTGFEKQETSNGPEYLFYGSNCINYYRDVHENVISSYYKTFLTSRPAMTVSGTESGNVKSLLLRLTVPKNPGVKATV